MTNADRDSVAAFLRNIVERLRVAPAIAEANALAKDPRNRSAFESGYLSQTCRSEAHAIERCIAEYLTPRTPAKRVRGRR